MEIMSKISVGIVEDNNVYRETLRDELVGCKEIECVFSVASSKEAHSELKKGTTPQVIVHDINLPDMSGVESCLHIKSISPSTHIMMLTVFDEDEKVFNSILNGAEGFLLKEAHMDVIVQGIVDVAKGGAVMSPSIAQKVLQTFSVRENKSKNYGLTKREKELLAVLIDGYTKHQIGDKLHISPYTVETHIKNIYAKLHVHSQIDLVSKVYKEGLI